MVNLNLDLYETNEHAQEYMRRYGITYQIAVPQSLYDSWWFFNCKNVPDPLPKALRPFTTALEKCIGQGLDAAMVAELRAAEQPDPALEKQP